ncbi:DUF4145 domain-containing protein [Burkholderia cepacia]|uniref:DUF4145 domain-containing protein n=1 Tax=Burkholderia cepacia TaxID=292 RepID=UPI00163A7070|nr:DUF4145 domain-containing protein [Burkholderia cepacia]
MLNINGSAWTPVWSALCDHCQQSSLWLAEKISVDVAAGRMIHPPLLLAPAAHPDMPEAVKADYEEARAIAQASPRGASALLRVCIEKLCTELKAEGKTINDQIGFLVAHGMPVQIQRALDGVRVIGNNAVHPGKMEPEDVADVSLTLFKLVNLIVENRITQPRMVDEVYAGLPAGALDGIEKRDA